VRSAQLAEDLLYFFRSFIYQVFSERVKCHHSTGQWTCSTDYINTKDKKCQLFCLENYSGAGIDDMDHICDRWRCAQTS